MTIGIDFDGDGEYDVEVRTADIRKYYLKVASICTSVLVVVGGYCSLL